MYYICIENNLIISILNYEPNVPVGIEVIKINDGDYLKIEKQTHYFNVATKTVEENSKEIQHQKQIEQSNVVEREFLNSTDWKILRHIRQKSLNIPTSLTENEYLELEAQRESAAKRII